MTAVTILAILLTALWKVCKNYNKPCGPMMNCTFSVNWGYLQGREHRVVSDQEREDVKRGVIEHFEEQGCDIIIESDFYSFTSFYILAERKPLDYTHPYLKIDKFWRN